MRQKPTYARYMFREQLRKSIDRAQGLWCEFFHDQAMWPMNGRYQCRTCLRYTPVPWETPRKEVTPENLSMAGSLQMVHSTARRHTVQ